MSILFPPLPYQVDELEPHISKATLEYHYGKHHRGYVTKLNTLIEATRFEHMRLEEIIIESADENIDIFNNAAQAWNHNFYWQCMTPKKNQQPTIELKTRLEDNFGNLENFKKKFIESSNKLFGSGWTWLVRDTQQQLIIVNSQNAETPLTKSQTPLLVCDIWEHAYYLDVQNERIKYLENFWASINWFFVESNLHKEVFLRAFNKPFELDNGRIDT